jgi:hypothetical protein
MNAAVKPNFFILGKMFDREEGRAVICTGPDPDTLAFFPEFADLAALHLRGPYGEPFGDAVAGAMNRLAGAAEDKWGRRFTWRDTYGFTGKTREDSLDDFARLWAIPGEKAREVFEVLDAMKSMEDREEALGQLYRELAPAWRAEALSCAVRHNLSPFLSSFPRGRVWGGVWEWAEAVEAFRVAAPQGKAEKARGPAGSPGPT